MNYGKKSTAKKRTALISRSSMMGKRARVSFIRVLFVSLIALCIAVTCLGVGSFRGVIDTAPDVDDIDIMPLGYATFLYDDAGNQIRNWLLRIPTDCLSLSIRYLLICSMQLSQLRMNVSMNITESIFREF